MPTLHSTVSSLSICRSNPTNLENIPSVCQVTNTYKYCERLKNNKTVNFIVNLNKIGY